MSAPIRRALVVAVPLAWLAVFFLLPLAIVAQISVSASAPGARPPYGDAPTFASYLALASDPLYWRAYAKSIGFATIATLGCIVLGYPMAYAIARAKPTARLLLLVATILPFWTSSLLRTYALVGLLRTQGLVNDALLALGVVDAPLHLLHTDFAVALGLVYNYLPFFVLPLAATLVRLDFTLVDAAKDLGASGLAAFRRVTLPLSMPGVVAGTMLVFIPTIGEFVIPDLLGEPDSLTIGRVLWTEFFTNRDWPLAASLAIAMLALVAVPLWLFDRVANRSAVAA